MIQFDVNKRPINNKTKIPREADLWTLVENHKEQYRYLFIHLNDFTDAFGGLDEAKQESTMAYLSSREGQIIFYSGDDSYKHDDGILYLEDRIARYGFTRENYNTRWQIGFASDICWDGEAFLRYLENPDNPMNELPEE